CKRGLRCMRNSRAKTLTVGLIFLLSLGGVPKRFHLLQCDSAGRQAIARQRLLDEAETPFELGVGLADSRLRIGFYMAGEIRGAEQEIADFVRDSGGVAGLERGFDFIGLLANFFDDEARIIPVETHS